MSRTLFGWPLYSDVGVTYSPVLSGGSWLTALPLSNLQNRELAKVARSSNDDLTSTIIKADLGVARAVRVVAGVKHNLSSAAKVRGRLMGAVPIYEDNALEAWTPSGTPVLTAGQADPFGGTRAVLVNDDDGAVVEVIHDVVAFTGDGVKAIGITLKAGTAAVTEFGIFDETALAWLHRIRATWSGGVPTLTTTAGSGTLYTPQLIATGFYAALVLVDGVTAANTNGFYLYPAGTSAASTGTVTAYEALAWDLTTQPVLYDSGVVDAWPTGIDAEEYENHTKTFLHVLSTAATGRYWREEIADTSNADGYVQLGRLAICGAWEPTYHMNVGMRQGWDTSSVSEESDGGAMIHRDRAVRRSAGLTFGDISHDEALANAFEMQAKLGTTKQLFVVLDPDDSTNLHRQSFLCRLQALSPLEARNYHRRDVPFALVEEL